ncbi:MAG: DTW domain-containing protein YfiP [Phenylobacterium sp.]|jgi:DTW domain-containing protein YfiP
MKFTLLTHQKELNRADNTGALMTQLSQSSCASFGSLGCAGFSAEQVIWHRKEPNKDLVEQIQSGQAVLLSPAGEGDKVSDISAIEHLIILDGTWQEARKMITKSDYLKQASWFSLDNPPPSVYHLRRNQVAGGLCTVECAIEVLKLKNQADAAAQLTALFEAFLTPS